LSPAEHGERESLRSAQPSGETDVYGHQETTTNTIASSRETTTPSAPARRISRIVRWSGRALLALLALIGGLAAVGAIEQAIATARDRRATRRPAS